ncbi:uncharacterized protein B0H18DRAFT_1115521 [Fomitopsis serialis]|uniref:uncharacterized protein n=1 Tax=Fomitopsis serialis TaxID=139415 RepID=UPI0020081D2B|nr:uncharacterized protein B0H18DRAFT_1115521 [Neoantrodia serialis]KAH9932864.1 hypothetical protein B0H18DRAFT_1115521 [Neoantrodia serialis]
MPAYRTRETSSRPLEVATDAPHLPPTVAIISPTPRAFSFPINNDVHFASPSSSPFEPDLKSVCTPPPLPRAFSPTSSIGSDVSSILSTPSARSSQASHKRRRSTASDIVERRPKKGDEDYIKRPENAFILFRRKCCEDRQAADEAAEEPVKKQRQADLSKAISQQWKSLSTEERTYWEDQAKEKKKEHEAMYPNYVYRPQRIKERAKSKKGKGRKGDGEQETDAESGISFVLPVPSPPRSLSRDSLPAPVRGQTRRAVSAPTPPPAYQTIHLPSVFMPSCPTSPSLLPRISRRSPRIPHPDDDHLTHFEYLPNDSLYPPTFQQPAAFEPNVQTDQLFQMFQAEQSALQHQQQQGGPLLQSLSIPRDSMMGSSLVSPAESIASSQFLSPVDHFTSPVSPSSSHGAPFTPAEAISMMALSLGNTADGASQQPDSVNSSQAPEMSFPSFSWPTDGSFWPDESMIPDDFDLSAIPPIELGISKFDGEMQQLAGMSADVPLGYDFESGEFPPMDMAPEHDLHDADPGQDPYGMFSGYDNGNMPW